VFGLPLAFGAPAALVAMLALPIIWYLLRLTPPRPQSEVFPPTRILAKLFKREETHAQSPWWLTLLRLTMAALVILAMSLPMWNPRDATLIGEGPVVLVIDDGWASGQDWEDRKTTALRLVNEARDTNRLVILLRTTRGFDADVQPMDAEAASQIIAGLENSPVNPNHTDAAQVLANLTAEHSPGSLAYLADGLQRDGSDDLAAVIGRAGGQKFLISPEMQKLVVITNVANDPDSLKILLTRASAEEVLALEITAYDVKGVPVSRKQVLDRKSVV